MVAKSLWLPVQAFPCADLGLPSLSPLSSEAPLVSHVDTKPEPSPTFKCSGCSSFIPFPGVSCSLFYFVLILSSVPWPWWLAGWEKESERQISLATDELWVPLSWGGDRVKQSTVRCILGTSTHRATHAKPRDLCTGLYTRSLKDPSWNKSSLRFTNATARGGKEKSSSHCKCQCLRASEGRAASSPWRLHLWVHGWATPPLTLPGLASAEGVHIALVQYPGTWHQLPPAASWPPLWCPGPDSWCRRNTGNPNPLPPLVLLPFWLLLGSQNRHGSRPRNSFPKTMCTYRQGEGLDRSNCNWSCTRGTRTEVSKRERKGQPFNCEASSRGWAPPFPFWVPSSSLLRAPPSSLPGALCPRGSAHHLNHRLSSLLPQGT